MMPEWESLRRALTQFAADYALRIAGAIAILFVGLIVASWAARSVRAFASRRKSVDPTLVPLLTRLVRWAVLAVTLVAVLDKFGVETSSLLTMIGAAGLAIGLALKDIVADVAAGIVLLVLRPFGVGDAVDIDGCLGVVDEIDVFETRLTSFDGVPIVVPNSKVRGSRIQNFTRAEKRRMDLTIGIAYSDDIDQARRAIEEVLGQEPRVLADPEPLVNVTALGESSVDLLVRAWTAPADFFVTQLDLQRQIKQKLDHVGISIPFPQREVRLLGNGQSA
jgi:small conductance mechanosensitive channel